MIRFLVYLIVGLALYKLLRYLVQGKRAAVRRDPPPSGQTAELARDPQCGTYVLPHQGVSARMGNKVHHFCSVKCRDEYAAVHPDEAGGDAG